MGNRIAPDGGKRISLVLLALALVASLVQVVAAAPAAQAIAGENGPAPIPGASTAGLSGGQWETKNQHRIWWNATQTRWDAVLPTTGGWQIARGAIPETFNASPVYGPVVSTGSGDRPDVYWDEATDQLYVLMSGGANTQLYRYQYSADAYTLEAGPVTVGGMDSPESRAAIYKTSNGDLWASVLDEGVFLVSRSIDDGATWATPVNLNVTVGEGQTQLTSFSDGVEYVAVAGTEEGQVEDENGRLSQYLFYKLPLSSAANFASVTRATATLNIPAMPGDTETITIGDRTYTFQTVLTDAPGHVLIGGTATSARNNLVAAINGTGTAGTQYGSTTIPHDEVTISDFAGVTATLTARDSAETGAGVALAETMAAIGNEFGGGATSLSGGSSPWSREPINIQQTTSTANAIVHADDEMSLVTHNHVVYIASETQRSGVQQGVRDDPQVVLFRRALGGAWAQSTVALDQPSNTEDWKRPVVAIHEGNIYVIAIDNPQTKSVYWVLPLTGIPFGNVGAEWSNPKPLFNTEFEYHRNNIVPREPTTTATGLPVLVDWAWLTAGDDNTVWQTLLPNSGNQAPGAFAGADKRVSASPATNLGGVITNDGLGGPVNWAWNVISGPAGPGAGVNFTNRTGQCSIDICQLPTTAAFAGGLGTYVLRLTTAETGTNPLSNSDDVVVTVSSLVNAPPSLAVQNPKNGDVYAPGAPVTFQATATDSGANISKAIVWTSSRDGVIGFGGFFVRSDLSTGTHTIVANVTDGQNSVSSPNITITIGSGGGGGGGGGGTPDNPFIDDDGSVFENAIEWLAAEGITQGCNPPTNNRFCPTDPISRGQMAAFLVRAFNRPGQTPLPQYNGPDRFVDDNNSVFEGAIERLAEAGITVGCNPPTNNRFCPTGNVTRGQMAAFLVRAFDLPAYSGPDLFRDDNNSVFEGAIERLAQAGITVGCNPPANDRFCPGNNVTRGQMAAFLKRAFGE